MTSGVYQLKFSSGRTYIGKSVDIEGRWAQHRENFIKGKAAKAMQLEYNRYGYPTGTVLKACHPDHIDNVESCLIARMNPELNSVRPADPFPGLLNNEFDKVFNMLQYSTWGHIDKIYSLIDIANKNHEICQEVQEELLLSKEIEKELKKQRSKEEIASDTSKRIEGLKESLVDSETYANALEICLKAKTTELDEYKSLSWWQRLWS